MKENYMETLLAQIREKRAREAVRQEVEGHILDQKTAYIAQGMSQEQAEERAILDMGDPVETGTALDGLHRPKPAWGMLALIAVLCAVGLLLLYLAQTYGRSGRAGDVYFQNQCIYVAVGFLILCVVYLTDYTRIAAYSQAGCIGILLVLCIVAGGRMAGNSPGFLTLSLSSLSAGLLLYLYLPLYGALLYSYRGRNRRMFWRILLFTVLPVFLSLETAHTSVTMNITVILSFLFCTAAAKGWFCLFPNKKKRMAALGAGLFAFLILALRLYPGTGYQSIRVQAWLHPEKFANGAGFAASHIRSIVSTSRLVGRNAGQAADVYLPDYITDYILTYTIGTFGILAGAALVMLVLLFGVRLLHLSIRQKNQLGMMMGLACSLAFLIQSAEYILVNLSLLPPASIYFPLISFGGSGMVQTCILLGILLSIYRYENVVPKTDTYADQVLQ